MHMPQPHTGGIEHIATVAHEWTHLRGAHIHKQTPIHSFQTLGHYSLAFLLLFDSKSSFLFLFVLSYSIFHCIFSPFNAISLTAPHSLQKLQPISVFSFCFLFFEQFLFVTTVAVDVVVVHIHKFVCFQVVWLDSKHIPLDDDRRLRHENNMYDVYLCSSCCLCSWIVNWNGWSRFSRLIDFFSFFFFVFVFVHTAHLQFIRLAFRSMQGASSPQLSAFSLAVCCLPCHDLFLLLFDYIFFFLRQLISRNSPCSCVLAVVCLTTNLWFQIYMSWSERHLYALPNFMLHEIYVVHAKVGMGGPYRVVLSVLTRFVHWKQHHSECLWVFESESKILVEKLDTLKYTAATTTNTEILLHTAWPLFWALNSLRIFIYIHFTFSLSLLLPERKTYPTTTTTSKYIDGMLERALDFSFATAGAAAA